jgi:hypothetical protein
VPVRCNGFKIKIDHLGLKFSFSIVLEICGLTNFSSLTCPTTQQPRQKSIANINKRNTSSSIYFFALSIGSMFSIETINSFNNITLKILSARWCIVLSDWGICVKIKTSMILVASPRSHLAPPCSKLFNILSLFYDQI